MPVVTFLAHTRAGRAGYITGDFPYYGVCQIYPIFFFKMAHVIMRAAVYAPEN
jgi:hypothetical protein